MRICKKKIMYRFVLLLLVSTHISLQAYTKSQKSLAFFSSKDVLLLSCVQVFFSIPKDQLCTGEDIQARIVLPVF